MVQYPGSDATIKIVDDPSAMLIHKGTQMHVNVSDMKNDHVLLEALREFSETVRDRLSKAYPELHELDLLGLDPEISFNVVAWVRINEDKAGV